MAKRFRVAVIGAGIGAFHVEGYLANPEAYEVAVICDKDESRGAGLAAQAPGATVMTSVDDVLARADIDIVDICLPPYLHFDMIEAALHAGKTVFCEKPLVGSLAEVDRLKRTSERTGHAVVPVYQYRYGNGLARLRRLLEKGVAGRPLVGSIETHWNRPADYYDVRWRGKKATELGGAILGHVIHLHDLLTFTLGPVRRVFARVSTLVNAVEVEDCGAITLEMESGALVTSSVTLGSADEISRMRFCFERLTVESPGTPPYRPAEGNWQFLPRPPGSQAEIDAVLAGFKGSQESFAGLFEALHPALSGTAPWPLALDDAYRSLELVSAIYLSSATGAAVDLPLPVDHPVRDGWAPWLG